MFEIIEYTPFANTSDVATLRKRALGAEDAATAESLLSAVSTSIRAECEWHIWPVREDDELTVEGDDGKVLALPTLYLSEVAEITEDGVALATTAYKVSPAGTIKRIDGGRWWSHAEIVVTMTHGYPDNASAPAGGSAAPPDLVALTCNVVIRHLVNASGASREQAGQVSITHSPAAGARGPIALLGGELDALKLYRVR